MHHARVSMLAQGPRDLKCLALKMMASFDGSLTLCRAGVPNLRDAFEVGSAFRIGHSPFPINRLQSTLPREPESLSGQVCLSQALVKYQRVGNYRLRG